MSKNCSDLVTLLLDSIATLSVSCTQAECDQSSISVIELLEGWLSHLGFKTEMVPLVLKYHLCKI